MKTYKHVTVEIVSDDAPPNPRDTFDHLSTFYGPKNSRYIIGGKQDVELEDWNLDAHIKEFKKEGSVIVEFQTDAGTCYAVVERSQMQDEYLKYGYTMRKALYWARHCAKGEVAEWLAFCNGEVYGYQVRDQDGNLLDDCYGFYGREYAEEQATSSAEYWDAELEKQAQHMQKRLATVCGNPA